MATIKSAAGHLAGQLRGVGIFIALLLLVVLFEVLTDGALLRPTNVSNIIVQNSYVLILAIGMVMLIIAGHIDLSVGSVMAFIGAATGLISVEWGYPWWIAMLVGLLLGALVGVWQGFWVAYVGIPAFIVTLAGMLLFRGLTQIVLGSQRLTPFPDEYRALGGGTLFPDVFPPAVAPFEWITVGLGVVVALALVVQQIRSRRQGMSHGLEPEPFAWFITKIVFGTALLLGVTYLLSQTRGTPIVLVVLGVLIIGYSAVMRNTVFGRHIYARGGNLHAAQLSGVKTKQLDFYLFVNMGVLAALAGIVFTGRLNSAGPGAGLGFELDAIAAAFIGGAAVTGGIGTVVGAVLGGLIVGVLNNGMSLLGVSTDYQQFIKGIVLLLAVAFDIYNKRRARAGG